jgi:hypothetical protein
MQDVPDTTDPLHVIYPVLASRDFAVCFQQLKKTVIGLDNLGNDGTPLIPDRLYREPDRLSPPLCACFTSLWVMEIEPSVEQIPSMLQHFSSQSFSSSQAGDLILPGYTTFRT